MIDVARLAGVSHQTVSRVLNDPTTVRPDTRARVQRAIAQLGYRRNSAARSLVTRRSETLGVIVFNGTQYGPASTVAGVDAAADQAGYGLSIANVFRMCADDMRVAFERLLAQGIDGLILIAPQPQVLDVLAAQTQRLPMLAIDSHGTDEMPTVFVDQQEGARLLVAHLVGLGHKTVHHIAGPTGWFETERRLEGWREVLDAHGLRVPGHVRGDWSTASGYAAANTLLDRGDVTAIFAANDQMALGALHAIRERGLRVPEDLSLVGFDDIPEAAYFFPPLTTVRQDFREVGRLALAALLRRIADPLLSQSSSVVAPLLVTRDSTASPCRRRAASSAAAPVKVG